MASDESKFAEEVRHYAQGDTVFNRFNLKRIVGRGGMGVVWLAWDPRLEREVALKFLPEMVRLDASAIDELRRETRRCLSLTHPNIVRIHDFHEDAHTAAMAMEFVDGKTFTELRLLRPGKVFAPSELHDWLRQLESALTYAHVHERVVHLDLKPTNLLINTRGQLKITDFGIASTISDTVSKLAAEDEELMCGSPPYMSPQQLMGDPPGVRDDIYSLGITLYEMLTGKPPFYRGNVAEQIQHAIAPPIAERRAELLDAANLTVKLEDIPAKWEDVIARCLAKNPEERPKSVAELAESLLPGKPKVRLPKASGANAATGDTAPLSFDPAAEQSAFDVPPPAPQVEPGSAAPGKRSLWRMILFLALALAAIILAGLAAIFADARGDVPPLPPIEARSAPLAAAVQAPDELIPSFLAPVKLGAKRAEMKELRPDVEFDEDPIAFNSDTFEWLKGPIFDMVQYRFDNQRGSMEGTLRVIEILSPIDTKIARYTADNPAKGEPGGHVYAFLKGALQKYGTDYTVHLSPESKMPLYGKGTQYATVRWVKGKHTVLVSLKKDAEGTLLSQSYHLAIYEPVPDFEKFMRSLHSLDKSTVDAANTFLTPEVIAQVKGHPTSWH